MLTLSLLRHAKSDRADARLDDHDRPLAPRGREAAPAMGAHMAANGIAPVLVLCSSARRARETLALVLPRLTVAPAVVFERELYLAEPAALLARLRRIEGAATPVLLVGHNPGLHELALLLARSKATTERERRDGASLSAKLPTAALVVLAFRARSWPAVSPASGRLAMFMTPKRLTGPTASASR